MLQKLECYDAGATSIIRDHWDGRNNKNNIKFNIDSDLPVVRLRKLNQKFDKNAGEKYTQLEEMVKDFTDKDPEMIQ